MIAKVSVNYRLQRSNWLQAVGLAVLVYLGLTLWFWYTPVTTVQGPAKAAGSAGVEISLGPAGRAAGAPAPTPALAAEATPLSAQPKQLLPAATTEKPAKPVATTPATSPAQSVNFAKVPPGEQPVAQPAVTELPDIPADNSAASPQLKDANFPPDNNTITQSASPTIASGDAGQGGDTNQTEHGSGDHSAGGSLPGDTADYASTLLAWLEQHKEYPRAARSRRQQGIVLLYFVLDRQGFISQQRIEQSSGYAALDAEALKMLERAQPLPAIPASMVKSTLELVVPVQFFLR